MQRNERVKEFFDALQEVCFVSARDVVVFRRDSVGTPSKRSQAPVVLAIFLFLYYCWCFVELMLTF